MRKQNASSAWRSSFANALCHSKPICTQFRHIRSRDPKVSTHCQLNVNAESELLGCLWLASEEAPGDPVGTSLDYEICARGGLPAPG
jgi:hypothetical protein